MRQIDLEHRILLALADPDIGSVTAALARQLERDRHRARRERKAANRRNRSVVVSV